MAAPILNRPTTSAATPFPCRRSVCALGVPPTPRGEGADAHACRASRPPLVSTRQPTLDLSPRSTSTTMVHPMSSLATAFPARVQRLLPFVAPTATLPWTSEAETLLAKYEVQEGLFFSLWRDALLSGHDDPDLYQLYISASAARAALELQVCDPPPRISPAPALPALTIESLVSAFASAHAKASYQWVTWRTCASLSDIIAARHGSGPGQDFLLSFRYTRAWVQKTTRALHVKRLTAAIVPNEQRALP